MPHDVIVRIKEEKREKKKNVWKNIRSHTTYAQPKTFEDKGAAMAHAPQPPSSKSELLINTTTSTEADQQLLMRPVNSLNPHAKPFVPQPTKALFLPHHAPPAMTHHFSYFQSHHPMNMNMMRLYRHPITPVRSSYSLSYPQQGNSNGEEYDYHVQLLRSFSGPKEAAADEDTNNKKSGDDGCCQVLVAGGETTLMIKNIPNRFKSVLFSYSWLDLDWILSCFCCFC